MANEIIVLQKEELQRLIEDSLTKILSKKLTDLPTQEPNKPNYIPRQDYAKKYNLSLVTVDRHVKTGLLKSKTIGHKRFILDAA